MGIYAGFNGVDFVMNPEVSLVKAVEVLPSQIGHQPKGTVILMPKSDGPMRGKRGRPRKNQVVTASMSKVGGATPADPVMNEDQKRAFDFFLALGDKRTIPKVADHFSLRKELVYRWGRQFGWGRKVKALANRPDLDIIESNLVRRLVKTTGQMVIPDKEHPGKTIANPNISESAVKDATAEYVMLRKNAREEEAHQKEMVSGPRGPGTSGRNRGGVMVNVVIQK